jgi:hypothetical protein
MSCRILACRESGTAAQRLHDRCILKILAQVLPDQNGQQLKGGETHEKPA